MNIKRTTIFFLNVKVSWLGRSRNFDNSVASAHININRTWNHIMLKKTHTLRGDKSCRSKWHLVTKSLVFFFVAQNAGLTLVRLIVEVSRSHTIRHTHGRISPERVISPSHIPLLTTQTTNTTDEHPYSHRDSNPRFQLSSGLRRSPSTAGPPGSALTGQKYFRIEKSVYCSTYN